MATVKIGLGRLYNAKAISNVEQDLGVTFSLDSVEVTIRVAKTTMHAVGTFTAQPPRQRDAPPAKTNRLPVAFPGPELFPADAYVEIVATERIEVDDSLALAHEQQTPDARKQLLQLADRRRAELRQAIDFGAGLLGLRLHSLLLAHPITEQLYVYRSTSSSYSHQAEFSVTVTESLAWDASRLDQLRSVLGCRQQLCHDWVWQDAAEVLGWLLRAWGANDPVLRFVSLFVPLECVIPALDGESPWLAKKAQLLQFLRAQPGDMEIAAQIDFVDALRAPPPALNDRFTAWAQKAALRGWEEDAAAFRSFNRMRNGLVHRGETGIQWKVDVTALQVRTLEDLVERYVCLALFGDGNVYPSASRPSR